MSFSLSALISKYQETLVFTAMFSTIQVVKTYISQCIASLNLHQYQLLDKNSFK